MIRINLATTKRRKPIQIPYAAILFVIGVAAIGVGYYFATLAIANMNDDLVEKVQILKDEIAQEQTKLDDKNTLTQQIGEIKRKIEQLEQLSGANLLQWSQVFSDLTNVVPEKTVWITNLRVDSDRRVQMTGYSCLAEGEGKNGQLTKGIQNFIQSLQGDAHFEDIFLSSATKNTYEKKPVWRFDITCRIKRDLGNENP